MQREIGALDEEATATGADPQPTSVHKGMKPRSGDQPNLPNREQTRERQAKVRRGGPARRPLRAARSCFARPGAAAIRGSA